MSEKSNEVADKMKEFLGGNAQESIPAPKPKEEAPKAPKRGRPYKSHRKKKTKLQKLLEQKGITQQELVSKIEELYPDEPISRDGISQIATGRRTNYSVFTLYRLCSALNVTPNMLLDWENEIKL